MLFADVAACSDTIAATSSRREKVHLLAELLGRATEAELPPVVAWLSGTTRQRKTGLGWSTLRSLPPPAPAAVLTVEHVDSALEQCAGSAGAGAATARQAELASLLGAATAPEQLFLRSLLSGGLRQGAGAGVMIDAVAQGAGQPSDAVRRAATFGGDLGAVAVALRQSGASGLHAFRLRVGVPVAPMLAQSAPDVASALERVGDATIDVKLDGVRVQIHRSGDDVAIFTRSLDEISVRLPEVVDVVRALPEQSFILDGEVIALGPEGRPLPFQVTAARSATRDRRAAESIPLSLSVFDVLHAGGRDLLDDPAMTRHDALLQLAPSLVVSRRVLAGLDPDERQRAADDFAERALRGGHEGVVVKSWSAPYGMGRRGSAWVKVKPRLTADLVVLAVERGNGRRSGWLSNLHLGARDPEGRYGEPGGYVMLGKTFKGLTDEMLAWQTKQLRELAVADDGYTVTVRPELVVEVAFDGVQTSSRYPAGLALRFARVVAYRPDRSAQDSDPVTSIAAHHVLARPPHHPLEDT